MHQSLLLMLYNDAKRANALNSFSALYGYSVLNYDRLPFLFIDHSILPVLFFTL